METSGNSVQSVDRVLNIIESLSQMPRGMTLTALSASVGLHVSTTHRLLSSLAARGYIQKDSESNKYRLTLRMFEIGSRVAAGFNILDLARPFLEHLADTSHATVHLVVREGDEIVYLYKVDNSTLFIPMSSFVGQRAPMYCTGVGKSILAALPQEEACDILNRTQFVPFTSTTITTAESMMEYLKTVRQCGFAIDDEEHESGIRCVAAPIIDFHGYPIAAISVSAASVHFDRSTMENVAEQVKAVTREITGLIGGTAFGA